MLLQTILARENYLNELIIPSIYAIIGLIIFFLIKILITYKKDNIFNNRPTKKDLVFLTCTIGIFLVVRTLLVLPQFIMYVDEGFYVLQGQKIASKGYLPITESTRSLGWSFLVGFSLVIKNSMNSVFFLNQLLFIGGGVLLYFLVKGISKERWIAFISIILYLFYPGGLLWSATADNFTSAMFFLVFSLLTLFKYYRTNKKLFFYLATSVLGFSVLIRRELIVVFIPILIITIYRKYSTKKTIRKKPSDIGCLKKIIWIIFICVLLFPTMFHEFQYYMNSNFLDDESGGQFKGKPFGLHNLWYNIRNFTPVFFSPEYFSIPLSILSILSVLILIKDLLKDKTNFDVPLFTIFVFISLYSVYFFSWFQTLGGSTELWAKTKFFWVLSLPMILLMAFGLKRLFSENWESERYEKSAKILITIIMVISIINPLLNVKENFNVPSFILQFRMSDEINRFLKANKLEDSVIVTACPELIPITPQAKEWKETLAGESENMLLLLDYSCKIKEEECKFFREKEIHEVQKFNYKDAFFSLYELK